MSFLRRLRDTTVIWRTLRDARRPSGAHKRGARSEFFGFNYNIALTDITGIFRGIFNEMARASIMVELYIDHRYL